MDVQMDRLVGGRGMNRWIIRPEFQLVLLASSSHILPFWSQFLLVLVHYLLEDDFPGPLPIGQARFTSHKKFDCLSQKTEWDFFWAHTDNFKITGLCSLSFKVRSEYMKKLFEDTRAIYSYNFEIISKLYNMFIPSVICVSCMNL